MIKYKDGVLHERNGISVHRDVYVAIGLTLPVKEDFCETVFKYSYKCWMDEGLTITSLMDGRHKKNSLHYRGLAFDMRTWVIDAIDDKPKIFQLSMKNKVCLAKLVQECLSEALGYEVQAVAEPTHIHVELEGLKNEHR